MDRRPTIGALGKREGAGSEPRRWAVGMLIVLAVSIASVVLAHVALRGALVARLTIEEFNERREGY